MPTKAKGKIQVNTNRMTLGDKLNRVSTRNFPYYT